jgi:hypothetical protein
MCVFGEMQMKMFKKFFGAAAIAVVVATASVAPANAALFITIDTGPGPDTAATSPGNEFLLLNVVSAIPFGFISTSLVGQDMLSGGSLMDVALNSSGLPSYNVVYTQTDIDLPGSAVFAGRFNTNNLGSGATVLRQLYLDTTNQGLQSIELTSLLLGASGTNTFQSVAQMISGPFSLTQVITVSGATSPGNSVSLDDTVHVPEPGTIALMIAAMLSMLGFSAWRRRSAH